ncbi:MAG: nucleoside deaminase [Mangrovibacterium sp.]
MNKQDKYMERAVELSIESVATGGGPFGAVIVRNGEVVAEASNSVTQDNDPTAHAEVNAIREACKTLDTFVLDDCEIYCSCEPCPMCLGAIYWSRFKAIYFANTKEDAQAIDFSDRFIYEEIDRPYVARHIKTERINHPGAIQAFKDWANSEVKRKY